MPRESDRSRSVVATLHDGRESDHFYEFLKYSLQKNVFINMQDGLEHGLIRKEGDVEYKSNVAWKNVLCQAVEKKVGPFEIKTNCLSSNGDTFDKKNPRRYTIFVKLKGRRLDNLYDYIRLIQNGTITHDDHRKLFDFIEIQRQYVEKLSGKKHTQEVIAINHNTDVPILHFKFETKQEKQISNPITKTKSKHRKEALGWNIFTGGWDDDVLRPLREADKLGPFYVSFELFLRKSPPEPLNPVTIMYFVLDLDMLPTKLRKEVGHLRNYNDHAWVEDAREVGVVEGVPVWHLDLGS